MYSEKKANMQLGNLDLQPGDKVKNVTEEEGRERGPARAWGFDNFFDGVGVVFGVVVVGGMF